MDGVPRDETAAEHSGDGTKNSNKDSDPDLFMNTSGEECTDDQESSNNPHILSELESEERDKDTMPPPNPPTGPSTGSEPVHGTEQHGEDRARPDTVEHAPDNPPNQTNPTSGHLAAGDSPTAAGPPAAAAGSTGAIFAPEGGSGSNEATPQAGSSSGSGIFNNNFSNFSFCATPTNVQKLVSKKEIPAEADATPSDAYVKIIKNKLQKGCPAAIGGIGHGQDSYQDCGSFYNSGDNRIKRGVYREDSANLCLTSLSFNPSNISFLYFISPKRRTYILIKRVIIYRYIMARASNDVGDS